MKAKTEGLRRCIAKYVTDGLIVAFSGGVDSTLLLRLAQDEASTPDKVLAVTLKTPFHSADELEDCRTLAEEMGASFESIVLRDWADASLMDNPPDRCYRCKHALFTSLLGLAQSRGLTYVADGAHIDDTKQHRPGMTAVQELGIKSPFVEAGLSKSDIRLMARDLGISVAEKPSTPCLATRLPYNTRLSPELFARIDEGENVLKSLGFSVVRLRVHGDIARIEIDPSSFSRFLDLRQRITEVLKSIGFLYVTLDIQGFRSGSMDE